MKEHTLEYAQFKAIAATKKFFWQVATTDTGYHIWGYDDPDTFETFIYTVDPQKAWVDYAAEQANAADFEANYKADCNRPNAISPTAAMTQFHGRTIEMEAGATMGYCEWGFDTDTFISKVMPMPIDAVKGDTLTFEVWARAGVLGEGVPATKVGQYGFDIPVRGSYPMGWIYGSGGGEIKSYCTVRCYYHRTDATVALDFNVIAEFLV
jgi:hypothetical protein